MKLIDRLAYLVAGTTVAGAVLAFAPISGELDPPGGPVEDTTPSLATLSDQITALADAIGADEPNLVESGLLTVGVGQSETFIPGNGETRRLVSVIVTTGQVDVLDANGRVVAALRANSTNPSGSGQVGFSQYHLNVDVELPLDIVRRSNTPPEVTVVYR